MNMQATAERITDDGSGEWVCICGNDPGLSGFFTYTNGKAVEPDDAWDGTHYYCADCLRVIDMNTLMVVAHPTYIEDADA